jgi:uncharacterized membrane protein YcgQ (UPF0703/DUF1980 family)
MNKKLHKIMYDILYNKFRQIKKKIEESSTKFILLYYTILWFISQHISTILTHITRNLFSVQVLIKTQVHPISNINIKHQDTKVLFTILVHVAFTSFFSTTNSPTFLRLSLPGF